MTKIAYSTGLPLPEALQRFETVDLTKPLTDADLAKLFGCRDITAALRDLLTPTSGMKKTRQVISTVRKRSE